MHQHKPAARRLTAAVTLIVAAAMATACSDSGQGAASNTTTQSSAAAQPSAVESGGQSESQSSSASSADSSGGASSSASSSAVSPSGSGTDLASYEGEPEFVSPGPSFDISAVKGKSIAVVPATSNQYDNTIQDQMKVVAEKYGVKYTNFPNQGQPTQWVSSLNQAIAGKPDLIILNTALDPRQVLAQIKAAKSAGIPVIATHFFDQDYSDSLGTSCGATQDLCDAGLTATVNAPFNLATRVEADWIIKDSGSKAHVMVITANDAAPTAGMVEAAKDEFAKQCPDCQVDVQNVLISDWPSRIPTLVSTALSRDPDLGYILPLFDFGAPYAVTGIVTAGKSDKVKVVSYNGTQSVLQLLQNGGPVAVDVGEPLNWLAYAFMDQAFRVLAGVDPVSDEHTPIRVFTADNVDDTGKPPTVTGGYGDAYIDGYEQLWQNGS
ncbi:MAG TPA: substrate-binding domain-containing protein [Nakamurella sp.]|nr:substrate-binding domain-containing protein [Nakamurella sp.]